jgi:hypothetical protein
LVHGPDAEEDDCHWYVMPATGWFGSIADRDFVLPIQIGLAAGTAAVVIVGVEGAPAHKGLSIDMSSR